MGSGVKIDTLHNNKRSKVPKYLMSEIFGSGRADWLRVHVVIEDYITCIFKAFLSAIPNTWGLTNMFNVKEWTEIR